MKLKDYLNDVSEREGKVYPGPWEYEFLDYCSHPHHIITLHEEGKRYNVFAHHAEHNKDAGRFLAASRTDVPKLIRLLRAAMEMRSQLRGCCDEFESTEKFDATVKEILGESK